jgi:GH24 family phage-related lysozyme (muramidase)
MHAKFLFVGVNLLLTVFASPVDIEARACIGPTVNAATIALLKEFEGFVERPEPDPIGLPTVGYGHLCQTKGCAEVPYDFPLTEETATKLMMSDLKV